MQDLVSLLPDLADKDMAVHVVRVQIIPVEWLGKLVHLVILVAILRINNITPIALCLVLG